MTTWGKRLAAIVLLAGGAAANAATYDIVTQFGASVFSYGTLSAGGGFTAFAHEPAYGRCSDHPEWDCFGGTEDYHHVVHTYQDVVPGTILLHPGPVSNVVLRFTAPVAGLYQFAGTADLILENCNGYYCDGTTTFVHSSVAPDVFIYVASTTVPDQVATISASFLLAAGDTFDLVNDKDANYYYDDTLFTGQFTGPDAVPEPAAWSLLIAGFAATGLRLRRRTSPIVAA